MRRYHGYFWPDRATPDVIRYIRHAEDLRVAMSILKPRHPDTVVQAGGHCGVWPLWLSGRFRYVVTVEPDPENFECLRANCSREIENGSIFAVNACLGEKPGSIQVRYNERNTGGHKGTREPGPTSVITIDGLQLDACELIVLDVEGMELPALQGAEKTLDRFSPVLMLEDRGHGDRHGWGGHDQLFGWLKKRGYVERARVSYDVVLIRADRP